MVWAHCLNVFMLNKRCKLKFSFPYLYFVIILDKNYYRSCFVFIYALYLLVIRSVCRVWCCICNEHEFVKTDRCYLPQGAELNCCAAIWKRPLESHVDKPLSPINAKGKNVMANMRASFVDMWCTICRRHDFLKGVVHLISKRFRFRIQTYF